MKTGTQAEPKTLPLVLASTSPYRKALLERLGKPFATVAPEVDERPFAEETPAALVARLAEAKARAAAAHCPPALVIGSDQVATLDGDVLGKPGDHANAVRQLALAAGRRVEFLTGLCLFNSATGRAQTAVEPFAVVFRPLGEAQLHRYVKQEKPFDCAGSFKVEGLGIALFERLEGADPNALIGLPLIRLVEMLEREGVAVP